jgi:pilus assembly protein CpaF
VERVRARLAAEGSDATAAHVAAAVRVEGGMLGDAEVLAVVESLRGELAGAGPLDPLLAEPGVTDVLVNGPDAVWVDRGSGLEPAGVRFADETAVRRLARRLAAAGGRRLDEAVPFVDAQLPGGVRLHAVLPPVAVGGTLVSLRVPARRPFSLADLVAAGSLSGPVAQVLRAVVESRCAFLVTGGTGTGKTTLLGTLLGVVDPRERVVIVEDSTELTPAHPHVVRLEARRANVEGAGEVALADLVRQALRMRPDRLVVGEVRGPEVVDLLAALNTGHEGGCGTVHANSAGDVPARLEALGVAAGMSRAAVHSQLAAAVDVVVHVDRDRRGLRRVAEVGVLVRGEDGLVRVAPALDAAGRRAGAGPVLDRLLRARAGTGP